MLMEKYLSWRQNNFPASKNDVQSRAEEIASLISASATTISSSLSAITADLTALLREALPPIPPGRSTILTQFDKLYDRLTGGWHVIHGRFYHAEDAAEWREAAITNAPVEREVGQAYSAIVKLLAPKLVLETGTNLGYSACCIADAMLYTGGGRLITIDVLEYCHLWRGTELEPVIDFVLGNSLEVALPLPENAKFDLLVLDSDHTYGTIAGEIARFIPMLKVGGVALFHDAFYFDGVGTAIKQIMAIDAFEVVTLPTPRNRNTRMRTPGLTIVRKTKEVQSDFFRIDHRQRELEINLPGRTLNDKALLDM